MKNKRVKQMIISGIAYVTKIKESNFWWESDGLYEYQQPSGHFEGDEIKFWWYWMPNQITSLTGAQLKGNK